jgi:hypothetical protein
MIVPNRCQLPVFPGRKCEVWCFSPQKFPKFSEVFSAHRPLFPGVLYPVGILARKIDASSSGGSMENSGLPPWSRRRHRCGTPIVPSSSDLWICRAPFQQLAVSAIRKTVLISRQFSGCDPLGYRKIIDIITYEADIFLSYRCVVLHLTTWPTASVVQWDRARQLLLNLSWGVAMVAVRKRRGDSRLACEDTG